MCLGQQEFIEALSGYICELDKKNISPNLQRKYIHLYIETRGSKKRVRYTRLVKIWGVTVETSHNIISQLKQYGLILTTQATDLIEDNKYGYLFVEPIIHKENYDPLSYSQAKNLPKLES